MVVNSEKNKCMLLTTAQKRFHLGEEANLNISLGSSQLKCVESDKLIGVVVDQNLTWSQHISKVLRSCNAHLSLLRRIKAYLPLHSRKTFFNAFILPHMEYCCTIWGGAADIEKLLKFQKRAARVILNASYDIPSETLFKTLHWMPIKARIDYKRSVFVYKALNGLTPGYCRDLFLYVKDKHQRNTRSAANDKLYIDPKCKKGQVQKTVGISGAKLWNDLDSSITNASSLNAFKTKYLQSYFKGL